MRNLVLASIVTLSLALTAGRAHAQATDVNVVNTTADPALVQPQSDSLPVIYTLTTDFADGQKLREVLFTSITPAGYYFIIDHIGVFASMPVGQRAWATSKAFDPTKAATTNGFVGLPLEYQGTDHTPAGAATSEIYIGNPSVSMFLPAGWNLRVSVIRNQNDGTGFAFVTVQGHLARIAPISRQ